MRITTTSFTVTPESIIAMRKKLILQLKSGKAIRFTHSQGYI